MFFARRSLLLCALCGSAMACATKTAKPAKAPPLSAPVVMPNDMESEWMLPPRVAATFPAEWRYASHPARPALAPHAMVVSNEMRASEAGRDILLAGGNAIDAAVATGFALAVVHPEAGNIGGGGFMLIRFADGTTAALDYREVAPQLARADMFLEDTTRSSTEGALAVAVPGAVAGMVTAQARFGRLPLARVMAPAIRLAHGFVVDTALARSLESHRALITRGGGAAVFYPGNHLLQNGDTLRQPALAATLSRIAEHGADGFYRGATADAIASAMHEAHGLITRDDLAAYAPIWRTPVHWGYRGFTFFGMPPVASGGITMAESMNMLGARDSLPSYGTPAAAHLLAEVMRRAFVDRNTRLGDPAFVQMPVDSLMSPGYANALAATIDPVRATHTAELAPGFTEGNQTTHSSVVDSDGNAVATTTTLNDLYGSGMYVAAAGFFLNDEMDDFTTRPGRPNAFGLITGRANIIAPGKRPLSAMAPTIVLDPSGHLFMVLGSRGGPRIITSVLQVLLNVIDYRMSLADAMDAPRIHQQGWPDAVLYEPGGLSAAMVDSLTARGYTAEPYSDTLIGRVHAIMRVNGEWMGLADSRTSGGASGY